jgi:hypothetical protein
MSWMAFTSRLRLAAKAARLEALGVQPQARHGLRLEDFEHVPRERLIFEVAILSAKVANLKDLVQTLRERLAWKKHNESMEANRCET